MPRNFFNLSNLTLLTALSLSAVAAYYSIYGLTAIFAGAVIPIIVMGSILEVGKITTTVWLRKYWHRCNWVLKSYLVPAVILLAFLTSMGIFGFLSKAHSEQNLVSGDVQAKIAVYDEKIKTAKENIDANRKALKQMDESVDQVMGRSQDEKGADKAVALRRGQAKERTRLLSEITAEQKVIAQLSEERAPIAAEVRKVEAEVGPIKYIAAFIYGDNPDSNLLERAVRWVIILIVIVFDPLAIALVLAANASKEWDKEIPEEEIFEDDYKSIHELDTFVGEKPNEDELKEIDDFVEQASTEIVNDINTAEITKDVNNDSNTEGWIYPHVLLDEKPKEIKKKKSRKKKEPKVEAEPEPVIEPEIPDVDRPGDYLPDETSYIVKSHETPYPWEKVNDEYVRYNGQMMRLETLKSLKPNLFMLTADHNRDIKTSFGTSFPQDSDKGDMFVRVDMLPNKVYKYDGLRWIEVNKEKTDTYLYNEKYIKYLVDKLENGQYDIDLLSENEKNQIEEYLRDQKS
jgi:hypothetical protein